MLRASAAATSQPLDARAITDPAVDPLLPAGRLLLAFVGAVLGPAAPLGDATRRALLAELGASGLVDAAGVIANFQMMNRIADATGMPVGKGTLKRTREWRELLGLDRYQHH